MMQPNRFSQDCSVNYETPDNMIQQQQQQKKCTTYYISITI